MAGRGGAFVAVLIVLLCSLPVRPLQACPTMFVFGDSLVDVGNNNHLPHVNNSCKANYRPYGIDHPSHAPTGRFSNGYNLADQLAQMLGFAESPPPFLSLTNERARLAHLTSTAKGGINFASGGSGLLPATGGTQVCGGQVISLAEQVGNFTNLVGTLEGKKRKRAAARLISESLFFISVGSNDLFEYSDHYADPRNRYDPGRNDTKFLLGLVDLYATYLTELYAAGATKFSVVSPSLVGCCPSQRKVAKDTKDMDKSGCLATANHLSRQPYAMIKSMLQNLSKNELPGMKYSLADALSMAQSMFNNIAKPPNNTTSPDHPCCGVRDYGDTGCNDSVPLCHERGKFFFWDRFHPTDWVSTITAMQLLGDNGSYVHPINVEQLVASRP